MDCTQHLIIVKILSTIFVRYVAMKVWIVAYQTYNVDVKICKISWITFINLFYQNFYHRMMSFIWMWVVDVCLLYIFYMYFIYIHLRKFVFCNFIYELLLLRSIENYNMKYTFYIILYNKKLVRKSTNPGLCYVIDCIKCNIIIIQSLCTLRINRTLRTLSKV